MSWWTAAAKRLKRWPLPGRHQVLGAGGTPATVAPIQLVNAGPATAWPVPLPIYDARSALTLPSVSRAVQVIAGAVKQMGLDDFRGVEPQTRPRLLERPDPWSGRGWFVAQHAEDYLLNGNAVHYVTARDAEGFPAAVTWLPAEWLHVGWHPDVPGAVQYLMDGVELETENVVHVRRGADRWCPWRGVGVVEQHLAHLNRVQCEADYQSNSLNMSAVPSIAIITPNPRLGGEEAKAAKVRWLEEFAGPAREPAILPAGTQVVPLGWSPNDSQMEQARKLSLLDVAHMFNLDGYFLGVPTASLTYQSPGPNYIKLLRETIEPVVTDFEDEWSIWWLPRGHRLRFDRLALTRDDFPTNVRTLRLAIEANIMTPQEARLYLALPSTIAPPPSVTSPVGREDLPAPFTPTGGR